MPAFCRGRCPYNALAANGDLTGLGNLSGLRDPHCPLYRRTFSHIMDRAMAEVFSEENMEAVVSQPDAKAGLLRRGKLISIMRDGPHPYETAANARQILAAVVLSDNLFALLKAHVHKHRRGYVGHEKILIVLARNDYEPDICFFGEVKAQAFTPDQTKFPAPDLVVEILSDSNEAIDRGVKVGLVHQQRRKRTA